MRRIFAVIALLVIIASCGRGAPTDQASFVSAAAARSLAAKSVRVTATFTGTPDDPSEVATGGGVIDLGNNKADLTLKGPSFTGRSEVTETIFDNGTVYDTIPAEIRKLTHTKAKWSKLVIPPQELKAGAFAGGGFTSLANATALLEQLKNISKSITVVGHPVIRGIETTEYKAIPDLSKAFPSEPDPLPTPTDGRIDVFIGKDGLVYRISEQMSLAATKMSGVIDFYDYGLPVHIKIPRASEVITDEQMFKLFEKVNSSRGSSIPLPSGFPSDIPADILNCYRQSLEPSPSPSC
jgi:hypothetical protein